MQDLAAAFPHLPALPETPPLLGEQLMAAGAVTRDQVQVALHEQTRQGGMVGQILCRLGYLDDAQLAAALAARAGLTLEARLMPEHELLHALPQAKALQWQMLPLRRQDGDVVVACADPFDIVARNQMQAYLGTRVRLRFVVTAGAALRQATERAYGLGSAGVTHAAPMADEISGWFAALLREAVEGGASDLHFAPEAQALHIRMRVDGVLQTIKAMHRDFWPALLQRIKILAGVNIAETRRPQDGRFSQDCGGIMVDCRAGFLPVTHGEAVALRLLDPRQAQRNFAAMGFTADQQALFHDWLRRPEGMILVTGPTGSGKSTTLNAMLQALDRTARNIMTLEDPVEYHFDGIRQTQVRAQHGLGFAEGVRTLLRHDPDVILIGEIRDAETAQQAMRAAMTGHLVLSSLHTSNAPGAVPRLMDLGVSRDLLAQHLRGVAAQRLVRTLCPHCSGGKPRLVTAETPRCGHCFGSGRRGRTVAAEILTMPQDGAVLFAADPLQRPAYATMWAHGMRLVQEGRVAADDLAASVPQG